VKKFKNTTKKSLGSFQVWRPATASLSRDIHKSKLINPCEKKIIGRQKPCIPAIDETVKPLTIRAAKPYNH
jgi:hypothetical protein